jgi:hypothetical protein
VELVAPVRSGDQFTPDQRLLAPPFQTLPVAIAAAGPLILLVSRVTAPLMAKALPSIPAAVVNVMLVRAIMFPANMVPVPMVAELPTCQNTLSEAPFRNTTMALEAVVRVEPI